MRPGTEVLPDEGDDAVPVAGRSAPDRFAPEGAAPMRIRETNLATHGLAVRILNDLDRVRFTDERSHDPFYSFFHFRVATENTEFTEKVSLCSR